MTLETFVTTGTAVLLAVVGYFLKKTHDKIDSTSVSVEQLGRDVDARIDKLEIKLEVETKATKSEIIQVFQDICHERQEACGKLQNAKLDSVINQTTIQCRKIEAMVDDRNRRWEKQENLNESFKRHLYNTKDGGASWDLADK